MKLKNLKIKNFRNFENISLDLENKNIIFGLNNVGKSNLIFALRLLLDKSFSIYQPIETDFFDKNTNKKIEIILEIEINNGLFLEEDDSKLVQVVKDVFSENSNKLFIKLEVEYGENERKKFFWGNDELDEKNKWEIVRSSLNWNDIYKIFEIVFISSTTNVDEVFKSEKKDFFKLFDEKMNEDNIKNDTEKQEIIGLLIRDIKKEIENLEKVKLMKDALNHNLKNFDDDNYEIVINSKLAITGYENEITIFMQDKKDKKPYPVSGDGIKKKVSYALIDLIRKERHKGNKIIVYLIEEPENHLFYSSHFDLANNLLDNSEINFLFLVTHSPIYINLHQNKSNINLVKIRKKNSKVTANSSIISPNKEFKKWQDKFFQEFATALFYDFVILVEGYSEEILFSKIINEKSSEANKIFIFKVLGIDFEKYFNVLQELEINVFVKTDNDISRYPTQTNNLGFNRINKLYSLIKTNNDFLELPEKSNNILNKNDESQKKDYKKKIFKDNFHIIQKANKNRLYLSEIDLEHDLSFALNNDDNRIRELLDEKESDKNGIELLQTKKWYQMIKFANNLNSTDIDNIFKNQRFSIIKDILEFLKNEL